MGKRSKTHIDDSGFTITDELKAWAAANVPRVDIEEQTTVFLDYWRSTGKTMADWAATWRNWMRRAPEFSRQTSSGKTRWRPEGLH